MDEARHQSGGAEASGYECHTFAGHDLNSLTREQRGRIQMIRDMPQSS